MTAATEATLSYGIALIVVLAAFSITPAHLAARSGLRLFAGPAESKSRAPALLVGGGIGAALAVALAGAAFGPAATLAVALLVLLGLLAALDMAWRWLPLEWCGLIAVIGCAQAVVTGAYEPAILGAALGGGMLFALRALFFATRGIEALGLGDVWLAAAIGSIFGPEHIMLILGLAAGLGLLLRLAVSTEKRAGSGVAFGAHICAVTPIFLGI